MNEKDFLRDIRNFKVLMQQQLRKACRKKALEHLTKNPEQIGRRKVQGSR
jgi:hypothetical protein